MAVQPLISPLWLFWTANLYSFLFYLSSFCKRIFFLIWVQINLLLQLLLLLLITVSWDPKVVSTLWTRNGFSYSARLLNALQAVKAKAVQTWQLLWISELGHTHRTGYFFMKIVQHTLNVNGKHSKTTKYRS